MAGSLVFIFLLDEFSGKINQSLETVHQANLNRFNLGKCKPRITDPILQVISKELDVTILKQWTNNTNKIDFNDVINDTSLEIVKDETSDELFRDINIMFDPALDPIFDEDNTNSNFLENHKLNDTDDNNLQQAGDKVSQLLEKVNIIEPNKTESIEEVEPSSLTDNASFLVAIFETLANVTAQTCGGTLLSPEWVLTVVGCINVLSNMSNKTGESMYTIIAETGNPLQDGTAHNVSQIIVNPVMNVGPFYREQVQSKPSLALMKIEPPITTKELELLENVAAGTPVTVYGWASGNDKNDSLHVAAFNAQLLSPEECSKRYNLTENNCFATSQDNVDIVNQMSWGGPIISSSGLVGIARGENLIPLIGTLVGPSTAWIKNVMYSP